MKKARPFLLLFRSNPSDIWEKFTFSCSPDIALHRKSNIIVDSLRFRAHTSWGAFHRILSHPSSFGVFVGLSHGGKNGLVSNNSQTLFTFSPGLSAKGFRFFLLACDTYVSLQKQLMTAGAEAVVSFEGEIICLTNDSSSEVQKIFHKAISEFCSIDNQPSNVVDDLKKELRSLEYSIYLRKKKSLVDIIEMGRCTTFLLGLRFEER